jgi:anti-sigma-K factor RskA
MLLYVAGAATPEEAQTAEALLCSAAPGAQADYAEAVALFHSIPLSLTPVEPPYKCCQTVMARISSETPGTSAVGYATRFRWPLYVSSGLAACLAVGLTLSMMNNRRLENRASALTSALDNTTAVMSSPRLTLASLNTADGSSRQSFARVLFCPISKRYQVMVYGLPPLPPGKAYELWLITTEGSKVPAGTFQVNEDGSAAFAAHADHPIDAVKAAITDEPAGGSREPTGNIHLVGALIPNPAPGVQ